MLELLIHRINSFDFGLLRELRLKISKLRVVRERINCALRYLILRRMTPLMIHLGGDYSFDFAVS